MNRPIIWPRAFCGFSLLELISTLSIASILLLLGIPTFRTLNQSNQMTAAVNIITTNLNLARSEAVKRRSNIVLCPTSDGNDCANTIRWDSGFIMYVDSIKNRKRDPEEQILRHVKMDSDSIHIYSTPGRKKTLYNPHGHSRGYNITLTFCDTNKRVDPKAVIVSNIGKPRLSSVNSKGGALGCSYN